MAKNENFPLLQRHLNVSQMAPISPIYCQMEMVRLATNVTYTGAWLIFPNGARYLKDGTLINIEAIAITP